MVTHSVEEDSGDQRTGTLDVAYPWYNYAMTRVRVSTTVDEELLATARRVRADLADSCLLYTSDAADE